jgi:hypothetical protein
MHSYHSPAALEPLSRSDPDLWREIYGYMQVCLGTSRGTLFNCLMKCEKKGTEIFSPKNDPPNPPVCLQTIRHALSH